MFKQMITAALALVVLLGGTATAGFRNQVLAVDLKEYDGREVLLVRSSHDMAVQSGYSRDADAATISILLPAVSVVDFASHIGSHSLVTGFQFEEAADGSQLVIGLARPELTSQQYLRISQPDRRSLMLEVFAGPDDRGALSPVVNPLASLEPGEPAEYVKQERRSPAAEEPVLPAVDVSALDIATFDLSDLDSQQVLALAADSGLLNLRGRVVVETENLGNLAVSPAGQSLANWMPAQPPGEIYLSGNPAEINDFLDGLNDGRVFNTEPLAEYWSEKKPGRRTRSYQDGSSVDSRRRLKDDPHSGLYFDGFSPRNTQLSDVRVTLQAPGGMNLYDVINYLSDISGISIIIDPYAFDEPTGGVRDPKVPEPPSAAEGGPGFRGADQFIPQGSGRSGSFVGNLVNVPFDTALELILGTHNLEFVVYEGSGSPRQSGSGMSDSGGSPRAYGGKPVILVTSPERLNQELEGTNEISLYQFHYADPEVVTDMLDSLGMLPGTDSGWYIYQGGGNGGFGGGSGGFGGGNGGGSGGNGGRGRVGGGFAQRMGNSSRLGGTASLRRSNGALVYRGSTRQPVLQEVSQALEDGREVIRVILRPEQDGQLVTLFAN